jgi:hypothetical protein
VDRSCSVDDQVAATADHESSTCSSREDYARVDGQVVVVLLALRVRVDRDHRVAEGTIPEVEGTADHARHGGVVSSIVLGLVEELVDPGDHVAYSFLPDPGSVPS